MRIGVWGVVLGVVMGFVGAPVAAAAPPPLGGLAQLSGGEGCITDGSNPPCAQNSDLYSPEDVAISPNSNDVYVAENYYGGVTQLRRDAAGGLAFVSCINATGANGCATFAPLQSTDAVAVSPDGKQVYAATSSGALVTLDRNASTGELTPNATTPCVSEPSANGCPAGHGITDLNSVAVSPDGNTVFASSTSGTAGGVAAFSRDQTTGALSELSCINQSGTDTCGTADSLDEVYDIVVSPDSKYVYAVNFVTSALTVLGFNGSTLSQLQCFTGASSPPAGCTTENALAAPNAITLAQGPSGVSSIYTADYNASVTTEWLRDPSTGLLTYEGCRSQTGAVESHNGICVVDPVQWGAHDVAASPDGHTVYVIGQRSNPVQGSQSIQAYSRDASSGNLTPIAGSCLSGASSPLSGCTAANGMGDPFAVAVSPNGAFVEVVSRLYTDGVMTFAAEVPPVCQSVNSSTTDPSPISVTLSCSDVHGNPLTLSIASGPAHGTLSAINGSSVTYTPTPGFSGTDAFSYTASDGSHDHRLARVQAGDLERPSDQQEVPGREGRDRGHGQEAQAAAEGNDVRVRALAALVGQDHDHHDRARPT
jgi:6-phosphogluconolactonase (cycloisomerase 2 family)